MHICIHSTARPETGRVQGASSKGMRATIHGIAHAESWAIDLMWDLIVRYALIRRGIVSPPPLLGTSNNEQLTRLMRT